MILGWQNFSHTFYFANLGNNHENGTIQYFLTFHNLDIKFTILHKIYVLIFFTYLKSNLKRKRVQHGLRGCKRTSNKNLRKTQKVIKMKNNSKKNNLPPKSLKNLLREHHLVQRQWWNQRNRVNLLHVPKRNVYKSVFKGKVKVTHLGETK